MIEPPSQRELFEAALLLPPSQRTAWLRDHCEDAEQRASIEHLLAAAERGHARLLDQPFEDLLLSIGDSGEDAALSSAQVGSFRLVDRIGEGGASVVYRAEREQAGVTQTVALKLLRHALYTPDEQRRFRDERHALTQLRHPGIAQLIEGGITDAGVPYIALELIEGEPITRYADSRKLDLTRRLELFVDVCRAVEAAHRALIVHRDLKPGNVMVTGDGKVKLLDFGIAKRLDVDADTHTQHAALTPAYAAPEQFNRGQITTATDVYALGVLLDELLTGERREHGDKRTPSSRISQDAASGGASPATTRAMRRRLRGDLDNIVLKATAEEPERRYASAGAFADDIERHLAGRPVRAHPPSRWYRMRKFVVRHRGSVLVTALFAVVILVTLALALWQGNIARYEAVRANALHDFMVSAFEEAEPSVPRDGPPRITEVVKQAIAKARSQPQMNSAVRTELLTELGAVLHAQGDLDSARNNLQWNYDRAAGEFGENAKLTLSAGHELAQALIDSGDYGAAKALIDKSLASAPNEDAALQTKLLFDSALLGTKLHEMKRALADGARGLQLARGLHDPDALGDALDDYGDVQLTANDGSGAIVTYSELLALREREFGQRHVEVASAHAALSRAYWRTGRLDDAEREIRAALAIDALVLPKDHWRHANHLNALMMVSLQQRNFTAALDSANESLRIMRLDYSKDNPVVTNELNNVGMINAQMENYADAVPPLREALSLGEAKQGSEVFDTALARADYGTALAHSGEWAAGEDELRHAVATLEALPDPDFDWIATTYEKLVRLKLDHHETAAALPLLDRIDASLQKMPSHDSYWDGRAAILRATTLIELNQTAAVRPLLVGAATALDGSANHDPVLYVEVALLQAQTAQLLGDTPAARRWTSEGLKRFDALRNPPSQLVHQAAALHH